MQLLIKLWLGLKLKLQAELYYQGKENIKNDSLFPCYALSRTYNRMLRMNINLIRMGIYVLS